MARTGLRPFFITGQPRSGTTLLRFMLSSHPHLHVPDETGFLPFLDVDPDAPLDHAGVTAVLRRIGALNRGWAGLVPDVDSFSAALPHPTLPFVLDALYRREMLPVQKPRWGDKTPLYVQYIPQIAAIFPEAQFVHVIRDGRDAALSARAKWGREKRYMDLSYLLRNWVRNVGAGQAAGARLGEAQYTEVRYEALVTEPVETLRGVLAFLDEEYDPAVLAFQQEARRAGGGPDEHVEPQGSLSRESIGRWRAEMTLFEHKLAQHIAGPRLAELGYEMDDVGRLTAVDRARLAWLGVKFGATDGARTLLYRYGGRSLNANRRT